MFVLMALQHRQYTPATEPAGAADFPVNVVPPAQSRPLTRGTPYIPNIQDLTICICICTRILCASVSVTQARRFSRYLLK